MITAGILSITVTFILVNVLLGISVSGLAYLSPSLPTKFINLNYTVILIFISTVTFFFHKFTLKLNWKNNLAAIVLVCFWILILIFLSSLNFSNSYDSYGYHFDAIYCLRDWVHPSSPSCNAEINAKHFPNLIFAINSLFVGITDNIQSANYFSLAAGSLLFLPIYSISKMKNINKWLRFTLIIAIISNPIILVQLWSTNNDGSSTCIFILLGYALTNAFKSENKDSILYIFIALMCFIFLLGSKFSTGVIALVSIVIICLGHFFQSSITITKVKQLFKLVKMPVLLSLPIFLWILYFPYITNIISGKHLFYPVFGSDIDWVSIINGQCFDGINRLIRPFLAQFTNFETYGGGSCKELKFAPLLQPFHLYLVHFDRSATIGGQAWLVAGFGPLFKFTLIFPVVWMFLVLIKPFKILNWSRMKDIPLNVKMKVISETNSDRNLDIDVVKIFTIHLLVIMAVQILVTHPSWISRYISMFWLLPFIVIFWLNVTFSNQILAKLTKLTISLFVVVNSSALFFQWDKNQKAFNQEMSDHLRLSQTYDIHDVTHSKTNLRNFLKNTYVTTNLEPSTTAVELCLIGNLFGNFFKLISINDFNIESDKSFIFETRNLEFLIFDVKKIMLMNDEEINSHYILKNKGLKLSREKTLLTLFENEEKKSKVNFKGADFLFLSMNSNRFYKTIKQPKTLMFCDS